jgi:hypothetical protein
MRFRKCIRECALAHLIAILLTAAEHRGSVQFGGLPLPGATVTATQGDTARFSTVTNPDGVYVFPDLPDGTWTIQVEMQLFAPLRQSVIVAPGAQSLQWDMQVLPPDAISRVAIAAASGAQPFQRTELNASAREKERKAEPEAPPPDLSELQQRAADGFLINGTVNNAAASSFAQFPTFGNNRRGRGPLYNGNLGLTLNNSALDARSFSLTGQDTPKPAYNRLQGLFSFGGPVRIPGLLKRNGPNFTLNYQWTRNSNATTQTALMPTQAERTGDLSASRTLALDPATGQPFPGNIIPPSRISPQAKILLGLYPLPNFDGSARYNFQLPIISGLHQDDVQLRANKQVGRKDHLSGSFAGQTTRTDTPNLFGFLNTGRGSGWNASLNWRHAFSSRFYGSLEYKFSRLSDRITPFFANNQNISGEAGITGNNQEPENWGPAALIFASGIATLSDVQASLTRNQTSGVSYGVFWGRGRHNILFGGGYGRQQFNVLSQQDPRGTFTFTGAAAGSDFAGFLLGVPDTSSIAFGNADKYLRASSGNAYLTDEWRISPGFTLNTGLRWEYWSPIDERYGRLVNLDIVSATPLIGDGLIHPDRNGLAPRVGFSWRPFGASATVVRGGYGIYYDTSVYQPIAMQMAQQAPLSKSLRIQNSPESPLTLANGFNVAATITPTTFAVDPEFRLGYSQNWQISIQRDLPWALQMTTTYLGIKGTRAQQQYLPNTFPVGALNPCPECPTGFVYLTSNGNSIRHAGQVQLRRRLRSGFSSQLQYTYSKSIDNASPGGLSKTGGILVAQNWLDLSAERGLSNFDQRHLLTLQAQYTSGMGRARANTLLKEWTIATQITAGTGLPLTPRYVAAVQGTGVTDSIRPDYIGGPALSPSSYAAPAPGQWGNAGRNSITGPPQFTITASLGRTFRVTDRINVDLRVDASNPLNYVTYPSWNTVVNSAQFGLPMTANQMRMLQTTLRMRF